MSQGHVAYRSITWRIAGSRGVSQYHGTYRSITWRVAVIWQQQLTTACSSSSALAT